MENLKHFLAFIQLLLNKEAKPVFFQWLDEYFRTHPLPSENSTTHDPLALLDSKEVCKLLKCNRHFLYELVDTNRIKFSRKGKALRFRRSDVMDHINTEFDG